MSSQSGGIVSDVMSSQSLKSASPSTSASETDSESSESAQSQIMNIRSVVNTASPCSDEILSDVYLDSELYTEEMDVVNLYFNIEIKQVSNKYTEYTI